jgi:hypothetical protein
MIIMLIFNVVAIIEGAYKELAASYAKEVRARKDLFNLVQELKGNIRVYCRVRPPNDREKADPTTRDAISYPDEGSMVVANEERKATHPFDFEQIFRPGTTQGYYLCLFQSPSP